MCQLNNPPYARIRHAAARGIFFSVLPLSSVLGCGPALSALKPESRLSSSPALTKGAVLYHERMESTPVLFRGQQIDVVSRRDVSGTGNLSVELHSASGTTVLPFGFGFVSALVASGTLHIFGTSDWSRPGNSIWETHSADLLSWSSPALMVQAAPSVTFWNTSVSLGADGYVMALEQAPGHISLLISPDLVSWSAAADFPAEGYAACPTVRYSNGYYYVMYLWHSSDYFATRIARSPDLTHWEFSAQAVVSPDSDEGENTSDLDLVETTDGIRILYAIGYQTVFEGSWVAIRQAHADGNLAEFLRSFFPHTRTNNARADKGFWFPADPMLKHYPHSKTWYQVRTTA